MIAVHVGSAHPGAMLWARIHSGAVRSIFGNSVRPSELAKLVVLIYVAVWLDAKSDVLNNIILGLDPPHRHPWV